MDAQPRKDRGFWCWRDGLGEVAVCFAGKGPRLERAAAIRALVPAGVEPAWLEQIHSATVREAIPGGAGAGDALITRRPALALAVLTADCVPILLAGRDRVAAVHAGWRGIAQRIVPAALARLGVPGDETTAWIGPAIGACCYEVGEEVAERVSAAGPEDVAHRGPSGRPHLDLAAAARAQLRAAGVDEIHRLECCTRCDAAHLWSYRRDRTAAGRNLALIWRRTPDL
ncbi:MAG: peptidoglycan editing factor PgeF [bacterium]|nr:peptidoglycan editing factor PgeF [bacterium]